MVASPAARTSAAKKEERYYQEYLKAKAELVKPEFWIDQESLLGQSKRFWKIMISLNLKASTSNHF